MTHEKIHARPKMVPSKMTDLELGQFSNTLPAAAERHRKAADEGVPGAAGKLQSTLYLLAQVRAEIDQRAGQRGSVAVVGAKLTPFEAFCCVARSVLPAELYGRIAREANALLGDEATPEECSALIKVRPRSA